MYIVIVLLLILLIAGMISTLNTTYIDELGDPTDLEM